MKAISRILIILVAALVVVGVTMAVTNSSSTAQAAPNSQNGGTPQMGERDFTPGQRPEGDPVGKHDGGSAFGWLGNLLPIAGIMFVVVVIERLWGKIFKSRRIPVPVK